MLLYLPFVIHGWTLLSERSLLRWDACLHLSLAHVEIFRTCGNILRALKLRRKGRRQGPGPFFMMGVLVLAKRLSAMMNWLGPGVTGSDGVWVREIEMLAAVLRRAEHGRRILSSELGSGARPDPGFARGTLVCTWEGQGGRIAPVAGDSGGVERSDHHSDLWNSVDSAVLQVFSASPSPRMGSIFFQPKYTTPFTPTRPKAPHSPFP